jgi:hypothetical protein
LVGAVLSLAAVAGCDLGGAATGERSTSATLVPAEVRKLEQVCADGRGFPGLPAYAAGKGAKHKVAHLWSDERDPDLWVAKTSGSRDLPASVFVDDKGDAHVVDAVLCQERVSTILTGKTCEMTDSNNGKRSTVTIYNAKYRLRLREARTGRVLLDRTVTAKSTGCPFLQLSFDEADRDKEITSLTDKQVNAVVMPYLGA